MKRTPSIQLEQSKVRIDKWLWAARFFKTRNLAKQAIEGGKVHVNGDRVKPSKDVEVGMRVSVRQGWDIRDVVINKLSEQRRGAPEAALLYTETESSLAQRTLRAEQRKAMGASRLGTKTKPTTKERRLIHKLKRDTSI